MMNANEVYGWTPISTTKELYALEGHIPILEQYIFDWDKNKRIELRHYAEHCSDGERVYNMFSVWWNNVPIMICQQAGRGGRDDVSEYVTDGKAYNNMVSYLMACRIDESPDVGVYDPSKDIKSLGYFYGHPISDYYNPDGVNPKYKVGDVVLVRAPMGSSYKAELIDSRVEIEKVFSHNPYWTYHGKQLDRAYVGTGGYGVKFVKKGKGSQGWQGSDSTIVEGQERKEVYNKERGTSL